MRANLANLFPESKSSTKGYDEMNPVLQSIFGIKHDFRVPIIQQVGPEQAEKILSFNSQNRNLRRKHVSWLAKQMELGYWLFTGQLIAFTTENVLVNLQHTLHAVIESNTTQSFIVMCGLPENAIQVIDTGIARTAGDVLNMNGIPNGNAVAAIVRKVMAHENGQSVFAGNDGGGGANKYTGKDKDLISHSTILETVSNNRDYWINHTKESLSLYSAFPVIVSSDMGFYYHIFKEKDPQMAWEFMAKFTSGIGLKKNTPIHALRQKFEKEIISKVEHTGREKAYWIRYCWNKFREGEQVKIINKYNPSEQLPEIV